MGTVNRLEYLEKLRAALQYDTLISCIYTYEERWAVHKEISELMGSKETDVIPRISIPEGLGKRSECRFNAECQTELYDEKAGSYRIVHPIEKN